MTYPASGTLRFRSEPALAGAGLILIAGLIYLLLTANFVGSVLAAFGIYRGLRWGWALGALFAGGAFVAYLLSGTVGLPGVEEGHLLEPWGGLATTHRRSIGIRLMRGKIPSERGRYIVTTFGNIQRANFVELRLKPLSSQTSLAAAGAS
jgi:hypothetical protein